MDGTGKKDEPPGKSKGKSKQAPPVPIEDDIEDDIEDGDFATPKPDRDGNDDEPL